VTPVGKRARRAFFPCPSCGADVREGALACKACGADDRTGWADDAEGGLDLPGTLSDEDYRDFVESGMGERVRGGIPLWTRLVGLLLVVVLVALALVVVSW
jgi:hypothetical protein